MIFGMEEMVSYISQYFVLEPGDMIWSGTMGSTRAMVPSDTYEVEIENIGVLRNEVVQEDSQKPLIWRLVKAQRSINSFFNSY